MKHLWIRSQLFYVSVLLLLIFGMTLNMVMHYNHRWDFTAGKVYSIAEATSEVLKKMSDIPLEVVAFYPREDAARNNFEVFLKQCQMVHPNMTYNFYDPDRVPSLAKQYGVREIYTIVLKYGDRIEKLVEPTEQGFTNALIRLFNPRKTEVCFVTGHGEASLAKKDKTGYADFKDELEENNFIAHEIILMREQVPSGCQVVVVNGPHHDFEAEEFKILSDAFRRGKGILFLIDPMDAGSGKEFVAFFKQYGVELGADVIVDKMSRMVGGDFLVPLVSQYVTQHSITNEFNEPTFYPVARSVQPSVDLPQGLEIVPLAVTGANSWSETNLEALEKGEAVFESEFDVLGPIPIAAAVEPAVKEQTGGAKDAAKPGIAVSAPGFNGRLVVVGDSDFLSNAYIELSGNRDLAFNMLQWLAKDERFIVLRPRLQEFRPLLLSSRQKTGVMAAAVGALPFFFIAAGFLWMWARKRSA